MSVNNFQQEEAEIEDEPEELRWNARDGLHAEKQRKVSTLKSMFEQGRPLDQQKRVDKSRQSFKHKEELHHHPKFSRKGSLFY